MGIKVRNKHNGRVASVGSELAKALVRMGKHEYATADMVPEPVVVIEEEVAPARPKRVYRRKDMRAE